MLRVLTIFSILVWFSVPVFADPFSDLLKEDFEVGQTLLIRNSVFQKLGGKSKDPKVIEITKNTIPWAIMEGLAPDTIADLIVSQYYVSLSGIRFTETEDAIPILSKQKLSDKDFVLVSLFVKETDRAGIKEEIRNVFLSTALKSRWDGFSILAGGRALIAGKYVGIPENRLASRVLGLFPNKGAASSFEKTDSAFRQAIFLIRQTIVIPSRRIFYPSLGLCTTVLKVNLWIPGRWRFRRREPWTAVWIPSARS